MLYVYAITDNLRAAESAVLPAVGILPEIPVMSVTCGPFDVAASRVPEAVFSAGALHGHLEDDAWVRERVLSHERVVAALVPVATVLPLKFCTLFSGEAALQNAVMRHRDALAETLTSLRGAREWGVKLFVEAPRPAPAPPAEDAAAPGAGAAFFRRKREEQDAQRAANAHVQRCVIESYSRLAVHARSAVSNPPQPSAVHGRSGEMVLNAAYLVAWDAEPAFHAALAELEQVHGGSGIRYELTGPWGPYNFAGVPLAGA